MNLNPYYCMDATKVLSADSWLNSQDRSWTSRPKLLDPGGHEDFRHAIDLLTNDELIRVRALPATDREIGVLEAASLKIMSKTTGRALPSSSSSSTNPQSITQDGQPLIQSFSSLLADPQKLLMIRKWIEFQLSDSGLQSLFWETNSLSDLQESIDCYRSNGGSAATLTITEQRDSLGYAREKVDIASWSPNDFFLAYAFWAYIKGIRYANGLDGTSTYVVHWLRESAVIHSGRYEASNHTDDAMRVPWGELVQQYISTHSREVDFEKLAEGIYKLRSHTVHDLESLRKLGSSKAAIKSRRDFLVNGFYEFLLAVAGSKYSTLRLVKMGNFAGEIADGAFGFIGKIIKYGLVELTSKVPDAQAKRRIKLMLATETGQLRRFIESGI